jgi:hypothetical protein
VVFWLPCMFVFWVSFHSLMISTVFQPCFLTLHFALSVVISVSPLGVTKADMDNWRCRPYIVSLCRASNNMSMWRFFDWDSSHGIVLMWGHSHLFCHLRSVSKSKVSFVLTQKNQWTKYSFDCRSRYCQFVETHKSYHTSDFRRNLEWTSSYETGVIFELCFFSLNSIDL